MNPNKLKPETINNLSLILTFTILTYFTIRNYIKTNYTIAITLTIITLILLYKYRKNIKKAFTVHVFKPSI